MANSFDKERKKLNILVISNENNTNSNNKGLIRAKNIKCPKYGEEIKIKKLKIIKYIYLNIKIIMKDSIYH